MKVLNVIMVACLLATVFAQVAEARLSLSLFGRTLIPGRGKQVDLRDLLDDCHEKGVFYEDGKPCCEGLKKRITCFPGISPSGIVTMVCTPCGDGVCGLLECHQNCKEDCKKPSPDEAVFHPVRECYGWGHFIQVVEIGYYGKRSWFRCCERETSTGHSLLEKHACYPMGILFPGMEPWAGVAFYRAVCTYCGNDVCGPLECRANCPKDCSFKPSTCGDKVCSWNETGANCPEDCPPWCGNGRCDKLERLTCPQDCFPEAGEETSVEKDESKTENPKINIFSRLSKLFRRRFK